MKPLQIAKVITIIIGWLWLLIFLINLFFYKGGWDIAKMTEYARGVLSYPTLGLTLLFMSQVRMKRLLWDITFAIYVLACLYLLPFLLLTIKYIPELKLIPWFAIIILLIPFGWIIPIRILEGKSNRTMPGSPFGRP